MPFLPNDSAGRARGRGGCAADAGLDVARAGASRPADRAGRGIDRAKSDSAKPAASQTTGTGNVAAVDPANPAQQKSLTARAIDKVKEVAKSAGDIFSRVPCLPPKGGAKSMGSLPHVAAKLASGEPVMIIAFGSSSTPGLRHDLT